MTGRAKGLDAVVRHVSLVHELFQEREEPGAVFLEDIPAHDKHIAEARMVPLEESFCVRGIVRVKPLDNADYELKVLVLQVGCRMPMLTKRCKFLWNWLMSVLVVVRTSKSFTRCRMAFVVKAIALAGSNADARLHDLAGPDFRQSAGR